MRVAAYVPRYPPGSLVGAWISTHEQLRGLADAGHTVEVVTTMSSQGEYDHEGISVYPQYSDLRAADVVISHLGDKQQGARQAARWGVPSVRMVHGPTVDPIDKLVQYPTALAVFASDALRDTIGWDGPQITIHPIVDPARYRTTPGDAITIINSSRAKGGDVFNLLAARFPDRPFLAVPGYGAQLAEPAPNVTIIGPTVDMRDVYAQTRIMLVPSSAESYGRVGVEAACSGIPTIAHPSPGLREALGDSATWIDRHDIDGWADTIRGFDDPDRWDAASRRAADLAAGLQPEHDRARFASALVELVEVAA